MNLPNIVASYWTFSGKAYPLAPTEVSSFSFEERVETAAKAGYRGMGLVLQDLIAVRDRLGYAAMKRLLDANGIVDIEVEIITDWFASGERRAASDKERAVLLEAGEKLGARAMKVSGDFKQGVWEHEVLVQSFADLCADAGRAGMKVGIELMPWTNFSTIENTMAVVRDAGAPNGGLFLDIWHVLRGKSSISDITKLKASDIISVEINDAKKEIQGDLWNDTLHHRVLPGEGSFDIKGFVDAVRGTGYQGPFGIEILSNTFRDKPLAEAASLAMDSMRRVFGQS